MLRALAEAGGPLKLSELARRAGVSPAVASREVMLLSARGLVEARRGPRNTVYVEITGEGLRALILAEQLLQALGLR